jgi:hypothetical protein
MQKMNMKIRSLWLSGAISISTIVPLIVAQPAKPAIPPLSSQQLKNYSHYIVVGTVTSIDTQKEDVERGVFYHHTAKIQVEQIEVSRLPKSPLKPGQTIEVHYWTVGHRRGATGSQRQGIPLQKGIQARFFIYKGEQKKLYLLEPNGWQPTKAVSFSNDAISSCDRTHPLEYQHCLRAKSDYLG